MKQRSQISTVDSFGATAAIWSLALAMGAVLGLLYLTGGRGWMRLLGVPLVAACVPRLVRQLRR